LKTISFPALGSFGQVTAKEVKADDLLWQAKADPERGLKAGERCGALPLIVLKVD
jgi:hypothetical protein